MFYEVIGQYNIESNDISRAVDAFTSSEIFNDQIKIRLTISNATGDGEVDLDTTVGTLIDKAGNSNNNVTNQAGKLFVDNSIPTITQSIMADNNCTILIYKSWSWI